MSKRGKDKGLHKFARAEVSNLLDEIRDELAPVVAYREINAANRRAMDALGDIVHWLAILQERDIKKGLF